MSFVEQAVVAKRAFNVSRIVIFIIFQECSAGFQTGLNYHRAEKPLTRAG